MRKENEEEKKIKEKKGDDKGKKWSQIGNRDERKIFSNKNKVSRQFMQTYIK